jgi:probable rRNA maturation factor
VAEARGLDPMAELVLYVVHGVLHLKGYDDGDPSQAAKMWRQQNQIMKKLGYSADFEP